MFLALAESSSIQLVPDGTIFIHIALILAMIWILNRTFFRPINRVLAERDRNKGGKSTEAQEILQQVETKTNKYDSTLREARTNGYTLIESERATASAERTSRIEAVKQEVGTTVESEKAAIAAQAEKARGEIAAEAGVLAEKISSNILK
jgi:F-type H+-transporting ATPase subunit b